MGKINGIVKDHEGRRLPDAEVLFVDRGMNVLCSGYANEDGEYYLQLTERVNGMVIGTYAYGETHLGFTFQNLSSQENYRVDVELGTVEFLNYQRIIGQDRGVYRAKFHLASLTMMKKKKRNYSPKGDQSFFKVTLEGTKDLDFILKKEEAPLAELGKYVDVYELTFPLDPSFRGKILELRYESGDGYGIFKTYL